MSRSLVILLIIFSITWIIILLKLVREEKISIKYSIIWLFMAFIILLVGIFPKLMSSITKLIGFELTSNFVIGILITILMFLTLYLTIIVTNQKNQIISLIQEISILKKDK